MLISVVLPAPLGPSRPKNSPSGISRLIPSSARNGPNRLRTCLISIAKGIADAGRCRANSSAGDELSNAVQGDERLQILVQILEADAVAAGRSVADPCEQHPDGRGVGMGDSGQIHVNLGTLEALPRVIQ